ncbi:hypothetical protein [Microbacterium sp. P5_E9]
MKHGWKALAGVAAAAALVLAPLVATAAAGEEVAPDDQVVTESLVEPSPLISPSEDPEKKVFVCKYVGTPGVNEHADHVVSVSTSTLDGFDGSSTFPFVFADGQNQSVAIAFDTGQAKPSIDECPGDDTPTDFPIPAQFNAGPTVTCGEADSFDTSFLGDPLSSEGSVYQFQNIYVAVDRSVAGQVTLTIWPIDGFTISGLSDAWDDGEGNYFRTIELNGPVPCPLADIPVTLTAPALDPQCGVENDELLFPEDTEGVAYYWEDDNPDNFNVVAVVEPGYVVDPVPAGWEQIDESEGQVAYLYAWVPVPFDEPCPVVTPTPTPPPALAATGGDVSPVLPIGAGMLMLTGVALMVARRLIKH